MSKWQDISTAPNNKVVLVSLLNSGGKRITVKAKFIPEKTEETDAEFGVYDEDADAYYCPASWYEDVFSETGLDYGYIQFEDKPTHWMPLPLPPQAQGEIEEPRSGDERTATDEIASLTQKIEQLQASYDSACTRADEAEARNVFLLTELERILKEAGK